MFSIAYLQNVKHTLLSKGFFCNDWNWMLFPQILRKCFG